MPSESGRRGQGVAEAESALTPLVASTASAVGRNSRAPRGASGRPSTYSGGSPREPVPLASGAVIRVVRNPDVVRSVTGNSEASVLLVSS
ncbi:hypothetical protein ABZ835_45345 [Streptomyces sp. NPDC047461]|uniref:hypothetical protein n=1 Tax=Streptomyces sp. NPDC047461 TaxID=3155619 RepID=UPI0034061511